MFKIIPEKVLLDNELPDKAKLIFADIMSWSLSDKNCFQSNEWFAERYKIHKNSVSRLIGVLIDKGYVQSTTTFKPNSKEIDKRILIPSSLILLTLEEAELVVSKKKQRVRRKKDDIRPDWLDSYIDNFGNEPTNNDSEISNDEMITYYAKENNINEDEARKIDFKKIVNYYFDYSK